MALLSALTDLADRRLNLIHDGEPASDARCVLLWVQRAQRASGNHAANLAVQLADRLDLPVIALFCLVPDYPGATLRAYHFMAEGLAELPDGFNARGIGWDLRSGNPAEVLPAAVRDHGAALVVTDEAPTRPGRAWKAAVAERLTVPVAAVDADVIVPSVLFPKEEWAPRTIRPKLWRELDRYAVPLTDPAPRRRSSHRAGGDPHALVDGFAIDRAVGPSPRIHGGQRAARVRLDRFIDTLLPNYHVGRNQSDLDASSGMAAYLHFGQIAPTEIAVRVREAYDQGGVPTEAMEVYFNELMVQRELAINFALRNPDFDSFNGIPEWGRKTLAAHASDPRPYLYDRETLETGRTHDRLWNAAQRQMVAEGFMPNRLRMYWAKQLLLWTATPEEAFATAVALNDRYFIDGRDANGYTGVAWSIGGRHDRPFPPNKPVFGLVRPMGLGAMKKHFDIEAYIRQVARQYPE